MNDHLKNKTKSCGDNGTTIKIKLSGSYITFLLTVTYFQYLFLHIFSW